MTAGVRACRPRGRQRSHTARTPLQGLLPACAALMLVAPPETAAAQRFYWEPLCGGDGTHWALLPDDPFRRNDSPTDDRRHGTCAHATCLSEPRRIGKGGRRAQPER